MSLQDSQTHGIDQQNPESLSGLRATFAIFAMKGSLLQRLEFPAVPR
jgi:hypothetical protein